MKKELSFFLLLFFCNYSIVVGQSIVQKKYSKSTVYTGIEVGSKGVKMSILESAKLNKKGAYKVIKDSSVNTDFINFTETNFNTTLNAFTGIYKLANDKYSIDAERIFTVISSGVKGQAEKENKMDWITRLVDSFKLRINEPNRNVFVIDVNDEAKLSHLGIVPDERRYTTFLIDIGSGNTKGGYFPNGNTSLFKLFNVSWGTKSIQNETEKRSSEDKTITNFNKQLKRVLQGAVNSEITYAVNESNAFAMSDYVAVSGGIAWSVATLMYPELATNTVVPVTYDDVAFFLEKIAISKKAYSIESVKKQIEDTNPDQTFILSEVEKVHNVFDQKALLSGTGLLLKIMRQFSGTQEKKLFYLVKNGQVGWISAYVDLNKK
jgi:hypothetical protein